MIKRFLDHFTMTLVGITFFVAMEWFSVWSIWFGYEINSIFIVILGTTAAICMLLFLKAVIEDFNNCLYRYKHWK